MMRTMRILRIYLKQLHQMRGWRVYYTVASLMMSTWLLSSSCGQTNLISDTDDVTPVQSSENNTDENTNTQSPSESTVEVAAGDGPNSEIPETAKEPPEEPVVESDEEEEIEVALEPDDLTESVVGPPPVITALSPELQEPSVYVTSPDKFVMQNFQVALQEDMFPVDILFLVDNSDSMRNEIVQVQSHLSRFLQNLSRVSHLKVGLMSAFNKFGSYHLDSEPYVFFSVAIPSSVIQINHRVRSWNSLLLAEYFLNNEPNMARDLGMSGSDFFRSDSLKIFVVVSDDDATDMRAQTFYRRLQQGSVDVSNVRFYGFVGLPDVSLPSQPGMMYSSVSPGGDSCEVASVGKEYYTLVSKYLKGALFDICSQDWQGYFSKIIEGVVAQRQDEFVLKHPASWITEIQVNGQKIEMSLVDIEGQILTLGDQFFEKVDLSSDPQITVVYKKP